MVQKRRRSDLKVAIPVVVITFSLVAVLVYAGYERFGSIHIHTQIVIRIDDPDETFTFPIPARIGIDSDKWVDHSLDGLGYGKSPIYTEDESGLIHVESRINRRFTLGEFFQVWGQRFNNTCLMQYCDGDYYGDQSLYVVSVVLANGATLPKSIEFASLPLIDRGFYRVEFFKGIIAA